MEFAPARFVNIGKLFFAANNELPTHPVKRGANLSAFNLKYRMRSKPDQPQDCLKKFVELFEDFDGPRSVTRLTQSFPVSKANEILALRNESQAFDDMMFEMTPSDEIALLSKREPRYSLRHDAMYVIASGLGSIDRATARWMISRGAKTLASLSRSGPNAAGSQEFI